MPKYIDTAWRGYQKLCVPADASAVQVETTKIAFFAGAISLWTTVLVGLEDGVDETPGDMDLMAAIQAELDEFGAKLDRSALLAMRPGGHG